MEEWRTYKLDELIDFQNGYAFKSEHFTEKGEFKIIKIKELKNGFVKFFDDTASIDITNSDLGYFEKFYVQKGDVLFALTGDPVSKPNELSWVGRVSIYNKTEKALLNQRTCKIVNKGNKVNTQYLYYYFRQPDVLYSLASRAKGSASQANLSTKDIGNLSITLPPRYVQDTIVDILGSLDYKIHINCQINDNLEQQARELFKSWFINSPQESWKEKSLSDYFNVITGKKDANYSTPEGAYPFFTCSQDILKAPSYSFDGHAILVAGNGDFNVKRYIGKFEAYQRTYVLIPHEEKFHAFLYLMIDYYLPEITGGSRGSVIKFITKGNIANFRFRVPQNNIDDQLKKLNDIYKIIDCNLEESSRLTKMRDTLLPKLMSGELKLTK